MDLFREPIGVIAVCIVVALGGWQYHHAHSYTKEDERNFIAGCSNVAPDNGQVTETCACIYRGIKSKLSYAQYQALDDQIFTSPPAWLVQLTEQCAAANALT